MRPTLLALSLLFCACSAKNKSEKDDTQDYKVSDFLSNCNHSPDSLKNYYQDSLKTYQIGFPHGWDVEIVFDNQVKGIYAMDTSFFKKTENIRTILISQLDTNEALSELFLSELKGIEDEGMEIIEIGNYLIDDQPAKWVMKSALLDDIETYDILVYYKSPINSSAFSIQMSVSNIDNAKQEFCQVATIVNSLHFSVNSSIATLLI